MKSFRCFRTGGVWRDWGVDGIGKWCETGAPGGGVLPGRAWQPAGEVHCPSWRRRLFRSLRLGAKTPMVTYKQRPFETTKSASYRAIFELSEVNVAVYLGKLSEGDRRGPATAIAVVHG